MDVQTNRLVGRIGEVAILAKASGVEDFAFSGPSSHNLSRELQTAASSCLQAHLDSQNDSSTMALRLQGAWWLFRAANEAGGDKAGRVSASLAFAALPGEPSPIDINRYLLGAFRSRIPSRETPALMDIELSDPMEMSTERAECAALCLGLGVSQSVIVDTPATAARTMEMLGEGLVDFVALMPRDCPANLPSRRAIVVSKQDWMTPLAIDKLRRDLGSQTLPPLGPLAALDAPPARREELLRAVMSDARDLPAGLQPAEVEWLFGNARTRAAAIPLASVSQQREWALSGRLPAGELRLVRAALFPGDAPRIAEDLRGQPDALGCFVDLFGQGVPATLALVSARAAAAWAALQSTEAAAESGVIDAESLNELDGAGLLASLSFAQVASLRALSPCEIAVARWKGALRREGMPETAVAALVDGDPPETPPEGAPAPAPDRSWLVAIDERRLVQAARWACSCTAWRAWWRDAMNSHPRLAQPAAGPEAEWSPALEYWIRGELRDLAMASVDALRLLGRWRLGSAGIPEDVLRALLPLCGIGPDSAALLALSDARPPVAIEPTAEQDLHRLLKAGIVAAEDVARAVGRGFPVSWLRAARFDEAAVALLDPDALPPAAPPPGWEPRYDQLLSRAVTQQRFWARWSGGAPSTVVSWMADRLKTLPGGALLDSIVAAQTRTLRLGLLELELIGPALGADALLRQAVLWAWSHDGDAPRSLALLADFRHRSRALDWLLQQTCEQGPVSPPPPLTAVEMALLLPYLHPVRDVVRVVMSWPDRREGEKLLLDGLIPYLLRCSPAAPPKPDKAAAARRPDWVSALAATPGWGHWGLAGSQPGGGQ